MFGADPASERTLRESALEYVQLLRFHIQKEDQVLFPLADSLFDPDAQRVLSRRFAEVVARRTDVSAVAHYTAIADELIAVAAGLGPVAVEQHSLPVLRRSCTHDPEG